MVTFYCDLRALPIRISFRGLCLWGCFGASVIAAIASRFSDRRRDGNSCLKWQSTPEPNKKIVHFSRISLSDMRAFANLYSISWFLGGVSMKQPCYLKSSFYVALCLAVLLGQHCAYNCSACVDIMTNLFNISDYRSLDAERLFCVHRLALLRGGGDYNFVGLQGGRT